MTKAALKNRIVYFTENCHYTVMVDIFFFSHTVTSSSKNFNLNNMHTVVESCLIGVAVKRAARARGFCGFASHNGCKL